MLQKVFIFNAQHNEMGKASFGFTLTGYKVKPANFVTSI